jgi:hypothetical protein
MTKSIKVIEEYMRKVGRSQNLWDDQFLSFLLISDRGTISRLLDKCERNSQQMRDLIIPLRASPPLLREERGQDYEVKILDKFILIEDYHTTHHTNHDVQQHTKIKLSLVRASPMNLKDCIRFDVTFAGQEWQVTRRKDQMARIKTFYSSSNIKHVEEIINKLGPTLEMLFFLDYFKYADASPRDHLRSLLKNNCYTVESLIIKDTKIEISETGDPT